MTHDFSAVPPPDVVPGEKPNDFTEPAPARGGVLAQIAAEGRRRANTWVFAGYTTDERVRHEWVKSVKRGEKVMLGGLDEKWNARALHGVVRNGAFVPIENAHPMQPTDTDTYAKYVSYLGPR